MITPLGVLLGFAAVFLGFLILVAILRMFE